ncbi:WAP four-disulfide core domain protein 5-like [Trichosurus vulpecula]|uniref:WAP four-disulfide core domain protein 5-like n=1 Tax=Trichosurus vulpecula TaxID=9337 RepID=UPI00186B0DDA|nr:WAP four-disulfide core domain protein 5-like [Trichosurus vulpecula]
MKSRNLLFLVASLTLATLASSGTLKPSRKETMRGGSCPYDPFLCIQEEPRECLRDEQCSNNQKCCYYRCGFKCVSPVGTNDTAPVKAGQCPPKTDLCLTPNQCEDDGHCQDTMKCCEGMCGKVCTAPVTGSLTQISFAFML